MKVFVDGEGASAYWLMGLSSPTAFAISIDTIMQFDFLELSYSPDILWSTQYSKIPIAGNCLSCHLTTSPAPQA